MVKWARVIVLAVLLVLVAALVGVLTSRTATPSAAPTPSATATVRQAAYDAAAWPSERLTGKDCASGTMSSGEPDYVAGSGEKTWTAVIARAESTVTADLAVSSKQVKTTADLVRVRYFDAAGRPVAQLDVARTSDGLWQFSTIAQCGAS